MDKLTLTDENDEQLSIQDQTAIAALIDELEAIAEAHIEGVADAERQLQTLLASCPPALRPRIMKRFEVLLAGVRADLAVHESLTASQQHILQMLKQQEQPRLMEMLGRASLRRIRAIFLHNPSLVQAVLAVGNALRLKGVSGIETSLQQTLEVSPPQIPALSAPKENTQAR